MSGIYSGVQARIAKKEPNALDVHCASHNLNLSLSDSVHNISEMRNFYDTIEELYNFFGRSIKRWAMLKELACVSEVIGKATLKRLCPNRWSSRHDSLVALRFRYSDVVKGLSKIGLRSDSHNERDAAGGLLKKIEKFEFIFLQAKLLETINALSKALQIQEMMLDKAIHLLKNSVDSLMEMRDSYAQVKDAAEKLSNKCGVEPKFQ
ncbi:zinc finger MYM-type protein 1-like [Macrobrachium rosenbergii]|uniref:zinc finger MYM-type protein 1-like n=1 Tax=Macrobrachium rosenbergii TaxID=79674 RepID=UPI0034D74C06